MPSPVLPQIKKIVYLMMENRSLDNVLGWLYADGAPHTVTPGTGPATFDGLSPGAFSNPAYDWLRRVKDYPVVPVPDGLGADQDRVPAYDPYEEMKTEDGWNGVLNQLFGKQDTIGGLPNSAMGAAPMKGFLQDYYAWYMAGWKGLDALWAYTPKQLPIINGLARAYAVSDCWFCSVPTQTNPNRAFSLCGTSLGRESNLGLSAAEQFDVPTLFNALARAGKSWGLYFTDTWPFLKPSSVSYTEYTFPRIAQARGNSETGSIDQFLQRAKTGDLPDFTYLEPKWGFGKGEFFIQGTDYHPPTHCQPAEQFLLQIYQALRNSPDWGQILFVVTFDEHGGTYDHVSPPWGAINPDGAIGKDGFRFDLFGVRVPTLLISPFAPGSSVFRAPAGSAYPFDHTSFIKTVLLWAGIDLGSPDAQSLGKRMLAAPTFETALSDQPVNPGFVDPTAGHPLLAAAMAVPAPDPVPEGTPEPPAGGGRPLNEAFAGVPYFIGRLILSRNRGLADILADVDRYRRDPEAFEAAITTGPTGA